MRRRLFAFALSACLALIPVALSASNRYDPRLRFRTISTVRFDIHFHQREEPLARRLAAIVEEAAADVDAAVGAAVGRVQIILVDQHDLSNGWATPIPYNTIEISAAAPPAESGIGNTADWLRLVFVHEYTHIAHLSRAGGWINGLRRGFGRYPLLFPNLYQPIWGIEGIATWQETRGTHEGRVAAGDFRLQLDRASASKRFEPLDRVNGGNVDWPSGNGPYLYGAYFHQFLSDTYGAESVRALSLETGRRIPYLGSRAYKKVFGRSLGQLWRDFEAATKAQEKPTVASRAVRLTHHGFTVSGPRYLPDGRLFYSAITPHEYPALMELLPNAPAPRVVAKRYLGNSIGVAGRLLIVDEFELVESVALQSDIYAVDPRNGHRARLTHEARAGDPDVARDGSSVVCAVQMTDRRALAIFSLPAPGSTATPRMLIDEPDSDFALPRWSSDARFVAAERRRRGGAAEIVLVDVSSRTVRTLATLPGGRSGGPVWTPDDGHVVFASAVDSDPFRIYRVNVATGTISRLEGTGASAQSPEISPDGQRLVFVGYTTDGYDLFSLSLAAAEWTPVAAARPDSAPKPAAAAPAAPVGEARAYVPWRTLGPQFWTPTVESDADEIVIGGATGSVDALGRHAYGIEAGWSSRARPDWQVAYAYDRWRPTIFAAFSDDTDPWRDTGARRLLELDSGILLPRRRVRHTQSTLASVHFDTETFDCGDCAPAPRSAAPTRSVIPSARKKGCVSPARWKCPAPVSSWTARTRARAAGSR